MKMMCEGNTNANASHKLAFHESDHQVYIEILLSICSLAELDDVDLIPSIMTDEKYKL